MPIANAQNASHWMSLAYKTKSVQTRHVLCLKLGFDFHYHYGFSDSKRQLTTRPLVREIYVGRAGSRLATLMWTRRLKWAWHGFMAWT